MTGAKIWMSVSAAGVVASGVMADLFTDAGAVSKMGLTAFMALCIIVLLIAISKLCKFIVQIIIPLKEALIKFSDSADTNTKILVEVKDTVRDCQARK